MGKLEHLPFEFETAETMLHLLGPGVPVACSYAYGGGLCYLPFL